MEFNDLVSKTEKKSRMLQKMLMIDDEERYHFIIDKTLSEIEVDIIHAHSGREALELMKSNQFTLIISDVEMPEINGFELAEKIRENENHKYTPIIFITGIKKEKKFVFQGYEKGAIDYLTKPIDPEIIIAKVKVFLKLHEQKSQLERALSLLQRTQSQLVQEKNLKSLAKLAGGIAHEFNNLLGGILGYTTFLEKHPNDKNADKKHKKIRNAIEKASKLTEQLLGFSRQGMYEKQDLEINEIITRVRDCFDPNINPQVTIKLQLSTNDQIVQGDPHQMFQILSECILNAYDSMPQGGKCVIQTENRTLEADSLKKQTVQAGHYVCIRISDTGHGMSPELKEKIFEPFFTNKETGQGAGLSLSMAYGVIKNHSGYITVFSEEGQGTTFEIYLPLKEHQTSS